jgi:hypothetical protein
VFLGADPLPIRAVDTRAQAVALLKRAPRAGLIRVPAVEDFL